VRQERGFQDRDEYKILTLFRPGRAVAAVGAAGQWNHKILVTHGGGCGGDYSPGGAPLEDYAGTIPAIRRSSRATSPRSGRASR
jgi:hypothetical protein